MGLFVNTREIFETLHNNLLWAWSLTSFIFTAGFEDEWFVSCVNSCLIKIKLCRIVTYMVKTLHIVLFLAEVYVQLQTDNRCISSPSEKLTAAFSRALLGQEFSIFGWKIEFSFLCWYQFWCPSLMSRSWQEKKKKFHIVNVSCPRICSLTLFLTQLYSQCQNQLIRQKRKNVEFEVLGEIVECLQLVKDGRGLKCRYILYASFDYRIVYKVLFLCGLGQESCVRGRGLHTFEIFALPFAGSDVVKCFLCKNSHDHYKNFFFFFFFWGGIYMKVHCWDLRALDGCFTHIRIVKI